MGAVLPQRAVPVWGQQKLLRLPLGAGTWIVTLWPFPVLLSSSSSHSLRRVNSLGDTWIACLCLGWKKTELLMCAPPPTPPRQLHVVGLQSFPSGKLGSCLVGSGWEMAWKTTRAQQILLHQETYTVALDPGRTRIAHGHLEIVGLAMHMIGK